MDLRGYDPDRICKRGHDLTKPENRYVTPDRLVECRACQRIIHRRYREKRQRVTGDKYKPLYLADT